MGSNLKARKQRAVLPKFNCGGRLPFISEVFDWPMTNDCINTDKLNHINYFRTQQYKYSWSKRIVMLLMTYSY